MFFLNFNWKLRLRFSTWATEVSGKDVSDGTENFCAREGEYECVTPDMPSCEDRTIVCDLTQIKEKEGMNLTDNSIQNGARNNASFLAKFTYSCQQDGKYRVIHWFFIRNKKDPLIKFIQFHNQLTLFVFSSGYVINIQSAGYPETWDIECIEPSGYNTQWRDQIWLEGRWKNLDASTIECIDPLRCYQNPPGLPFDYTVEANLTSEQNLRVNTTVRYQCAKECKLFY